MPLHTVYVDALDEVLSWDLPDDACSLAIEAQARLLAGFASDESSGFADD